MTRPSLDDLSRLAITAGREILSVRAAGFEARRKGDGSIVTIADQRAEHIIEQGLAMLAPDIPMLGEEACAAGRIPDACATFFCVDPLDGTQGFARGGDEFTVNIALVEAGAPSVGVIYAPVSGELYAGEPGRAVRAVVAGEDIAFTPMHTSGKRGANWRLVASRTFSDTKEAAAFGAALGQYTQVASSSSIKFCRVAEGAADIYARFGEMSEWDAAAGHAILSAAGGGVMGFDGATLTYGHRDDGFRISGLVAYSDENAWRASLQALKAIRA